MSGLTVFLWWLDVEFTLNEDTGNVRVKKFHEWMNRELLFASPCTIVNRVNFQKVDGQRENYGFKILESWLMNFLFSRKK